MGLFPFAVDIALAGCDGGDGGVGGGGGGGGGKRRFWQIIFSKKN